MKTVDVKRITTLYVEISDPIYDGDFDFTQAHRLLLRYYSEHGHYKFTLESKLEVYKPQSNDELLYQTHILCLINAELSEEPQLKELYVIVQKGVESIKQFLRQNPKKSYRQIEERLLPDSLDSMQHNLNECLLKFRELNK